MTIGERIKAVRAEKGYSQKELSVFADIIQKNLSTYENDLVIPSAIAIQKIALALGVSTDYLLGSAPVELKNVELIKMLHAIEILPKKEKESLMTMIQTFLNAYKKSKNK